uniref:Uncharacterized protein n=1 Tax=Anguilla anguilla TaxID=7936 RepID=A0A0E9W4J2_ANGAN
MSQFLIHYYFTITASACSNRFTFYKGGGADYSLQFQAT